MVRDDLCASGKYYFPMRCKQADRKEVHTPSPSGRCYQSSWQVQKLRFNLGRFAAELGKVCLMYWIALRVYHHIGNCFFKREYQFPGIDWES
ncbi:hypothetical protein CEXT_674581 [Caerostris extrusa]|uniref:Uncharacterized protein n=1 Tax=Caerostris extrusa TaxID=172846 RepID=A0AAV4S8P3_CAEEX|nr:hypothetical protein CEXT_674581 [Caerostris extrusa]